MAISSIFTEQGGSPLANYEWIDLANGLGYIEFTCGTSKPSGTLTYHLLDRAIESGNTTPTDVSQHERRGIIANASAGANTFTFTTSPFSSTRTLQGKVFVVFTIATSDGHAPAGTDTPSCVLKLNSTQIGTATGAVLSTDASKLRTYCLSFTPTTSIIKKGDTLSLLVTNTSSGANSRATLYFDSLNRDVESYAQAAPHGTLPALTASEYPSELTCFIPFRIDL